MTGRNDAVARVYDVLLAVAAVPVFAGLGALNSQLLSWTTSLAAAGSTLAASAVGVAAFAVPGVVAMAGLYGAVCADRTVRKGDADPFKVGAFLEDHGLIAPTKRLKGPERTHRVNEQEMASQERYQPTGEVRTRSETVRLASRTYPDLRYAGLRDTGTRNIERSEER